MAQHGFSDCPECGADVRLKGKPYAGQILYCSDCRMVLEVDEVNPVFLIVADRFAEEAEETPRKFQSKTSRRLQYIDN